MEVLIGGPENQWVDSTSSVIVSMARVETRCENARPGLLMALLLIGLGAGVFMNLPFLHKVLHAWRRYFKRLHNSTGEEEVPNNATFYDATIELLVPTPVNDGDNDAESDSSDGSSQQNSSVLCA